MKKFLHFISALTAAAVIAPSGAFAAEPEYGSEYDDELVTFIVQTEYTPAAITRMEQEKSVVKRGPLKSMKSADPSTEVEKKNEAILENAARELEVDISDSIIYTEADSGFTITCRRGDMEKLLALDGVINVEEDGVFYAVPDDEEPEGDEVLSSAATEAEYIGQGTLIAIIDSGFDLDHPYFAAAPESEKLTESKAGGKIASLGRGRYVSQKIPFAYDYYSKTDASGQIEDDPEHGTHVAGIAAGKNGVFTANVGEVTINGAAPEAQLALMACSSGPNSGSLGWAVVKQAIDDAVKLDADVINMSLGSSYVDVRHGDFKTVQASITNARKAGIVVCVSEGNSSRGFYDKAPLVTDVDYGTAGFMGNYTDTFSVASVNAEIYYDNLTRLIAGDGTEMGANTYPDSYTSKTFAATVTTATEYVDCGKGLASDFTGKTLTGKIALIQRGDLSFEDKTKNAKNAGAKAAIIYDNVDEPYVNMANCVLPSVFVTKADGERLVAAETKTVEVNGTIPVKLTDNTSANQPSSFTSWGFSETMQLTPNISAYGGNIYSAAPGGGYQKMSGTSMASPYIAGASACVRSYLNTKDLKNVNYAELIQQLLMSTAIPLTYPDNDALPYSPRVQGAGMVSAENAIKSPVILYNSSGKTLINLGDNSSHSLDYGFMLSFTAENLSDEEIIFNKVDIAVTTDWAEIDADGNYVVAGSTALTPTYTAEPVTVPAHGKTDVSIPVKIDVSTPNYLAGYFKNGIYLDGFIRLSNDDCYAGMPFSGFRGSWCGVPVWDSTIYDEGGSKLIYEDKNIKIDGTYLKTTENKKAVIFGGSGTKYTVISPKNADGYYDTLTAVFAPKRSLSAVKLSLVQGTSEKVSRSENSIYHKFKRYEYPLANTTDLTNKLKELPDGDYKLRMTGTFDDGKNKQSQNLTFPITVTIDNTAPDVDMTLSDDYKTLTVTAEDENYLRSITVNYTDMSGAAKTETKTLDCTQKEYTQAFSLTDANPWTISVTAMDYARNSVTSEEYAMTASADGVAATAFKKTLSGTSTYTGVSGTVTSGGVTKSFDAEFGNNITLSGGDVLIGIIVEGLYDNTATAEFNLK